MRPAPDIIAALRMPLRDALRGVASLADATEDALEPAVALLPDSVQGGFRAGLGAARSVGRRLMTAPIDTGAVRAAADMLAARARAPETLATVVAYAWEHLRGGGQGHLISETLLAARLSTLPPAGADPAGRAAHLVADIRTSAIIGRRPSLHSEAHRAEQARIDHALAAIAVWLLAARGRTMAEEETLLGLAFALTAATRGDAPADPDDVEGLARHLQTLADHL